MNEFRGLLYVGEGAQIFFQLQYYHFEINKKDTMLVIDDASVHRIENIRQKIKDCDTKISMIPEGLTRYHQPLDVSINKTFKD